MKMMSHLYSSRRKQRVINIIIYEMSRVMLGKAYVIDMRCHVVLEKAYVVII